MAMLTHHFFDVPLNAVHKTDDVVCVETATSNTRINGKTQVLSNSHRLSNQINYNQ